MIAWRCLQTIRPCILDGRGKWRCALWHTDKTIFELAVINFRGCYYLYIWHFLGCVWYFFGGFVVFCGLLFLWFGGVLGDLFFERSTHILIGQLKTNLDNANTLQGVLSSDVSLSSAVYGMKRCASSNCWYGREEF